MQKLDIFQRQAVGNNLMKIAQAGYEYHVMQAEVARLAARAQDHLHHAKQASVCKASIASLHAKYMQH